MSDREAIQVDLLTILLYSLMVLAGWANIYAAGYSPGQELSLFSIDTEAGKQLLYMGGCLLIILTILVADFKLWDSLGYFFYGLFFILLVAVLFFGNSTGGAQSWFAIPGVPFKIQPSEFAKVGTALAVAKFVGNTPSFRFDRLPHLSLAALIVGVPTLLILLQPDAGTVLVFTSFVIAFYREGLTPVVIWIGLSIIILSLVTLVVPKPVLLAVLGGLVVVICVLIVWRNRGFKRVILAVVGIGVVVAGYVLSVDYGFNNFLLPHQQNRILLTLGVIEDPSGAGYHQFQAETTISSGGTWGTGFLQGERTQTGYVPEQSTDFIFTTVAEEHGFVGSLLLILAFVALLLRIVFLAERQKSRFARVYGYAVFGILFFHLIINLGMNVGLFPVVGIPLPFFSYGGSSLWSFTVLLFILIKLDAHRGQVLMR